jgi:hypothetical protein
LFRVASGSTSKLMGTQKIGAPVEIGNLMQQQCAMNSYTFMFMVGLILIVISVEGALVVAYIKNRKRKLLGLNYVSVI